LQQSGRSGADNSSIIGTFHLAINRRGTLEPRMVEEIEGLYAKIQDLSFTRGTDFGRVKSKFSISRSVEHSALGQAGS
jgi:hypothetical protein